MTPTKQATWKEGTRVSEAAAVNLIEVDQVKCCGYGMCAELSPDVFSLDEHGFVVANRTEIPEELMPATEDAVYSCPEKVLKLTRKAGLTDVLIDGRA